VLSKVGGFAKSAARPVMPTTLSLISLDALRHRG